MSATEEKARKMDRREVLTRTTARGPLIVDFCLRIGHTTILLGPLGFFGLGLPPESPDWGGTINEGRKLLLIYGTLPCRFCRLCWV